MVRLVLNRIVVLCLIVCFLWQATAAQQKRIYIAPDDHTDYMWTADEETYRNAFLTMTDYYLNRMDATAGNPSPYQARWNADGSFWMWIYEKNRTPAQFDRLINRIRDGHFSVPLNALVLVEGGSPAEAVLRGMLYSGLIERRYNIRFPIAIAMENQTLPYGLSSLWAGAGAKYSWKGVCNCATQVPQLENRDREIYYCGGADGSRVLMKWYSYLNAGIVGGYDEGINPVASINFVDTNSAFTSRYPFSVIGIFGQGSDALQTTNDDFILAAQSQSNANRQVIVSNQLDFFQDFETNHGANLPTFAASYGNEWDVLVSSMAEVSARVKRASEKLRGAEAMATLVALNNPSFMNSRIAERDKAMLNFGLYYEHDWTADGTIEASDRAQWQRRIEKEITDYVDKLHDDARRELAGQISRSGSEQRFFVFNPLGWARTDYADIPLRLNRRVHVIDVSTGAEVPSQLIRYGTQKFLRVRAENVPSVGYKVYEIRSGGGSLPQIPVTANGNVIENEFYRVTVTGDGAISSLIDKTRNNREVVRNIDGSLVNDLGGNRSGTVYVENEGPVSTTLRAISSSPLPHQTRVTLYRNSSRIDIDNQITENFGDVKLWRYTFDINSPDVRHEEVGAVIRAKLLANGGHYSPRNARYDWLTMNHFADMSNGAANNFGVTISNADAYFMKLGSSTELTFDTSTPQINVLVGGQIDGAGLGIPNQHGDSYFRQRFALQTHGGFDQTNAMRFSLEHQNPLITGMIEGTGNQTRQYPANNFSFAQISNPNVLLWALKPAEDGISRGIVARVWNQSNSPASYNLGLSRTISSADRLTHIETFTANATVSGGQLNASINQQQIQTHLLRVGN